MEMSNKKQQIPTIRFKGFTDTWEQRKLGENVIIKSGWAPSNFIKTGSEESELFIKVNDLNYSSREQNDSQMRVHDNPRFQKMKKGSIIFPKRGAAIMTNKVRILGSDGYMDTNMMALEPQKIDGHFLYTFITRTGLYKIADTSTIPQINNKHIEPYIIYCPSIEEQTKVGAFFKKLDNTISLHQRQLNNYKQQKKYMLQKMFPKDGEKVPEVRFDGFTEEWEQCNLGDVAMIKTGYPFNSEDFDGSGKYLVITNGNIQNDLAFVDNSLGNRIDVSDTVLLNNYELNIGDVLVTMDGTVGRTAKVICSNQIIAQRVGRLIAKDNSEFLYQSLNTGDFSKEMKKVSHGGTIKHISLTEISDYAMFVPATVEEQTKIGAFFKHLDDATDHHQQKVNGYQQLKNAMLQQMFV